MMISTAATRNGNPLKPNFEDLMYIGLKMNAPKKLQNVSTVATEENMAPKESKSEQQVNDTAVKEKIK